MRKILLFEWLYFFAANSIYPLRWRDITYSVSNNQLNRRVVIGRATFMPRLEVENFSQATTINHAATKYIAALEPAEQYSFVRFRNIEWLAIDFFFVEYE